MRRLFAIVLAGSALSSLRAQQGAPIGNPSTFLASANNVPQAGLMFQDTKQEPEELGSPAAIKPYGLLRYQNKDFLFDFTFRYRPESFYTRNVALLSGSPMDQSVYAQSTWDFKLRATKSDYIRAETNLRTKGKWGVSNIFGTTDESVQMSGIPFSPHSHNISRLLINMREAYVDFSVNKALNLNTAQEHSFTIGAFSYELGRGISLGNAYAVSQGLLGFFADNAIDQFAYGALLHGDITPDARFHYDLYFSMLQNFSGSASDITKDIYSQRVLPQSSSYRGFGSVDFIAATRVLADILRKEVHGIGLTAELYGLFNHEPEQKIDFTADASSELGTIGFAAEVRSDCYEFGFEVAKNLGHQNVWTWDRNRVNLEVDSSSAVATAKYSDVLQYNNTTGASTAVPASYTKTIRTIVNAAPRGVEYNGAQIGAYTSGGATYNLINSATRYTPAYQNKYMGIMAVADGAIHLKPKVLKLFATAAYASGDENPNYDLDSFADSSIDGDYLGFIGLQEIYSGKRLRSIFILGPQRITRILSSPTTTITPGGANPTKFANRISGFTNLIYSGVGLAWTPQKNKRRWEVKPGMLFYWQDVPSRRFVLKDGSFVTDNAIIDVSGDFIPVSDIGYFDNTLFARKFLGTEVNCFIDLSFLDQLKFYAVVATFFPGDFYRDVFGTPLSSKDYTTLERSVQTGEFYGSLPLLGKTTAFAFNAGMQYEF
jgi:hypothetical protein